MIAVVRRNIRSMEDAERKRRSQLGWQERLAELITRFAGSMPFAYLHLLVFGFWISANAGLLPGVRAWDPSFVMLGMVASVEAIFLSTFILISQNIMVAAANRRAELDLQVNLLAEHEVTKLIGLVSSIAERMGATLPREEELREIAQDVKPEVVMRAIDDEEKQYSGTADPRPAQDDADHGRGRDG
ncbi:DUF1003 domain-containing protein [Bosea sp. CS1GBMeth4]|uniref:DUF1003 domain-containing protein n=1 Tax=Bosea sp. CS1GBMeth4 TaxID=1892849 RepID=UPI0016497811|nr:DUF1003 domain-containing protein [Bosea sp. CS1GBMeth4]